MNNLPGEFIWAICILLAAYLVALMWVGKIGAKHSRSMAGFSLAKGNVSPWVIGISFGATFASANLFIGVPGWAYTYGAPTLWWALGCFGMTWLGLLLFARTFWRQGQKEGGSITLPHWLRNRYHSRALQVIVAFLALFNIYYIIGQNVGLATMFETIMGVPYMWGLVLGVGITIIYLGIGGAYAQYISDGIQGIIMMIISVILFISLAWTIGGGWGFLGNLGTQLEAIDKNLTAPVAESGPFFSIAAILSIEWLLFAFGLLPHLMNKVLSLSEEKDLRPFTLSAGITLFFLSCFSVFAGMAARVILPALDTADSAIPAYISAAFSPTMVALMVTGILAAILSTTNSLYLGLTTIIGNDLYRNLVVPVVFKGKNASPDRIDKNVVFISRIALLVVGVVSLLMSINRPASLALLTQFGISAIISGVIAPISLGYFWKRATRTGAVASAVFGSGCYIFLTTSGLLTNVFLALAVGSIVGFTAMITAGFLGEYSPEARVVGEKSQL